jgi:hypothetical protein
MKKKKTSVTLSIDLLEKLQAEAVRRRWSLSKMIQVGLEEMVAALKDSKPVFL